MIVALISVLVLGAGYLAGRLHGKAAHHRFLARGFRIMSAAARRDGVHDKNIYDLAARPVDVSNAFGKQEDIDAQVQMVDVGRSVVVKFDVVDRASPAFKAAVDRLRMHGK